MDDNGKQQLPDGEQVTEALSVGDERGTIYTGRESAYETDKSGCVSAHVSSGNDVVKFDNVESRSKINGQADRSQRSQNKHSGNGNNDSVFSTYPSNAGLIGDGKISVQSSTRNSSYTSGKVFSTDKNITDVRQESQITADVLERTIDRSALPDETTRVVSPSEDKVFWRIFRWKKYIDAVYR